MTIRAARPRPVPAGRDLLVKVKAVSVNPVDTKVREGASPEAGQWKVLGWDAVGTVAIGALLIVVAVLVAIEVKAMLIGQSVDPYRQAQIRAFLDARPEIAHVISVITLQLGNDAMVSVQARMREEHDAELMLRAITAVERGLKNEFPEVRWSFFEPELPQVLTAEEQPPL